MRTACERLSRPREVAVPIDSGGKPPSFAGTADHASDTFVGGVRHFGQVDPLLVSGTFATFTQTVGLLVATAGAEALREAMKWFSLPPLNQYLHPCSLSSRGQREARLLIHWLVPDFEEAERIIVAFDNDSVQARRRE